MKTQKTTKETRDYQRNAIDEMIQYFNSGGKNFVLAMAPGAGKTYTACQFIKESGLRTVVLAHGTDILRTQWLQDAKEESLQVTDDVDKFNSGDYNILIQLPHTLYNKAKLTNVDLLVIDEAHEFYFAYHKGKKKALNSDNMVSKIKKIAKPKKMLFLTGTPSKFIHQNSISKTDRYKIHLVSAGELLDRKLLSNVYVGIAESPYKYTEEDYTDSGELKSSVYLKGHDTEITLQNVITSLIDRLESKFRTNAEWYALVKNKNFWDIRTSAATVVNGFFQHFHKTMISCRSQKQARDIYKYLNKLKIKAVLSTSDDDVESEKIAEFKSSDDILVLVVCARGKLGFNYPDLVNLIDLRCSTNIDCIYQLLARVMRVHPKGIDKFFYRVSNRLMRTSAELYTAAAMSMIDHNFFSKFNGKNLNAMEIIVRQQRDKSEASNSKEQNKNTSNGTIIRVELPLSVDFLQKLLTQVKNRHDGAVQEVSFARIGDVRRALLGFNFQDPNGNKQAILDFIRTNVRKPSRYSKDTAEKRLYVLLNNYITVYSGTYDLEFKTEIEKLCEELGIKSSIDPNGNKQAILDFIRTNVRKPSYCSKDPAEKRLYGLLNNYITVSSGTYDLEFKTEIEKLCEELGIKKRNRKCRLSGDNSTN